MSRTARSPRPAAVAWLALLLGLCLLCGIVPAGATAQEPTVPDPPDDRGAPPDGPKGSILGPRDPGAVSDRLPPEIAGDPSAVPRDGGEAVPEGGGIPEGTEHLSPEHRRWLEEVGALISDEERAAFLALQRDYQREAFIQRFWRQRDPYPETARNELRRNWDERVLLARQRYGDLADLRAEVLLLNGPPPIWRSIRCRSAFWPMEVWIYPGGSDLLNRPFALIFFQRAAAGPWQLWHPTEGERFRSFGSNTRGCLPRDLEYFNAARALIFEQGPVGYMTLLIRIQEGPQAGGEEWVSTFASYTTELPAGAETFEVGLSVDYPGWFQHRTVAQGVLTVPLAAVGASELGGHSSYNFLLTGEVLTVATDGSLTLFDTFRYRYDLPAGDLEGVDRVPLVFQRYLRPGDYTLVLRLEDLGGERFSRVERPIVVPAVEGERMPPPSDPRLAAVLAEANAALAAGQTTIKLVPPMGELLAGLLRFDTLVTGDQIQRVVFSLDGEPIFTKNQPPYSVELDLGDFPRTHELMVQGFNGDGLEVASDELLLNADANRFRIRLVEPVASQRYEQGLRARAEVVVPRGEKVDRVEVYLNDDRLATLYQPPYVQPVVLPRGSETLFVRAVAYLTDGSSTEDVVFVNAPDFTDAIGVQYVELYASVLDRNGRPVKDVQEAELTVQEDGVGQQILRFEQVENLPIHAAILLDTSASMDESLDRARGAALSFFQEAVNPRDRAALITFNDRPYLATKFTNDLATYAGGLAGLKAERSTALYDSIIYGLFYFTGIKGQRAMLVLSDGKDESSRFEYDEALEYARRAGVTIYSIGLGLKRGDGDAKRRLTGLADETGGRSFFIDSIDQLAEIYRIIQQELRSQYLVAYQSTNNDKSGAFRAVEVEVDRRGLEVKTIRGYYP